MRVKTQKKLSILTVAAVLASVVGPLMDASVVDAAGVSVTLSPDSVAASDTSDVVLTYTPAVVYVNADTITVSWDGGYTDDTATVSLTNADTDFGSASCVVTSASNYAVCTITATGDVTGLFTITVGGGNLIAPGAAGSYSWAITSSKDEYGAALQYVADDNDVIVTANIAPTLSFNIRDATDSNDLNLCDLGTVTTSDVPDHDTADAAASIDDGVAECVYGLAIGTNAQGGFKVSVLADEPLNNANATIDDIGNDDSLFSATTTEAYGLDFVRPAQTGRNTSTGLYDVTISADDPLAPSGFTFGGDTTSPVPYAAGGDSTSTAKTIFSYTDGISYTANGDSTDLSLVVHGLRISSGTPAGTYTQVVTYTVTPTF